MANIPKLLLLLAEGIPADYYEWRGMDELGNGFSKGFGLRNSLAWEFIGNGG